MRLQRRPALTRETVTQVALRLLNEVGLDGLTTRRLAAELSVQSPALYWHFQTKQDLLDAVADAIIVAAGMGTPREDEPWQAWLMRRARAYRASLLAHRDSARLVANARQLSPATITSFNDELTAMLRFGFSPTLALRTITALSNYVTGFVLREHAGRQENTDEPRVRLAALAGLLDAGASAPLVLAIVEGGSPFSEDAFDFGLRALIDGATAALVGTEDRVFPTQPPAG